MNTEFRFQDIAQQFQIECLPVAKLIDGKEDHAVYPGSSLQLVQYERLIFDHAVFFGAIKYDLPALFGRLLFRNLMLLRLRNRIASFLQLPGFEQTTQPGHFGHTERTEKLKLVF